MRKDRDIAIKLRKQGKTYYEITTLLDIPKSTLSGWLNGLEIPAIIKNRLWSDAKKKWAENITNYNKKRALDTLDKNREAQRIIAKEIGRLTKRELMLVGAALYWAEGNKKDRWRVRFSNSDPGIVTLTMRFFREICKVKEDKFIVRVHIYPNLSEIKAKMFWSKLTDIPTNQFRKSLFSISKSSKLKRPPNTLPYGTIEINISDVNLVNRIKGWILGLSKF